MEKKREVRHKKNKIFNKNINSQIDRGTFILLSSYNKQCTALELIKGMTMQILLQE